MSCSKSGGETPASLKSVPVSVDIAVTTTSEIGVQESIKVTTSLAEQSTAPTPTVTGLSDKDGVTNSERDLKVAPATSSSTTTVLPATTTTIPYQVQTYEPNEAPSGPVTYEPSA